MKQLFKTSLLMLALWGAAACSMDKMGGSEDPANKGEGDGVGYLLIGGLSVNADTESSEMSGSGTVHASSRAGVETTDFEISIADASGNIVQATLDDGQTLGTTFKNSDLNISGGGRRLVALRPGVYTVTAHSPGAKPQKTSSDAWYTGSTQVTVEASQNDKGKYATASVICKLAQIRVTAEISADLRHFFKTDVPDEDRPGTLVTISHPTDASQAATYLFGLESTRTSPVIYFEDFAGPESNGNQMVIQLTGWFSSDPDAADPDWQKIDYKKTITGVKAATYRDIRISIDYGTTGNLEFTVTINSYVYDDTLETDASSSLTGTLEPTIPDDEPETPPQGGGEDNPKDPDDKGDNPTIEWLGYDIEERYTLTNENRSTTTCKVRVLSAGLEHLYVNINDAINGQDALLTEEELGSAGMKQQFDLTDLKGDTEFIEKLQGLKFLPEGKDSLAGETDVTFEITDFLGALYFLYPETHDCDFELTAVDRNGSTKKSVKFHIEK